MSRQNEELLARIQFDRLLSDLTKQFNENNEDMIVVTKNKFKTFSFNYNWRNIESLKDSLNSLKPDYTQFEGHIDDLLDIVEGLKGKLRAKVQMQLRLDENISEQTFAMQLLFQFESKIFDFPYSEPEEKSLKESLLDIAFPPKKQKEGRDERKMLMDCFSDDSYDNTVKIRQYVDFITSISNKIYARFAAEVLFYMISKDEELREKLTPIQMQAIYTATESATWKKAVKRVSHSMINPNKDSGNEDTIQKVYRGMASGGAFTPPIEPRKAIDVLLNLLPSGNSMQPADVYPLKEKFHHTNPMHEKSEKSSISSIHEGVRGDSMPKHAPPPPPFDQIIEDDLSINNTIESKQPATTDAHPKKAGGSTFLDDIKKLRKDVDAVEMTYEGDRVDNATDSMKKNVSPPPVKKTNEDNASINTNSDSKQPATTDAHPKKAGRSTFLDDIKKLRKDVDAVEMTHEGVRVDNTSNSMTKHAAPPPPVYKTIEDNVPTKTNSKLEQPEEVALTKTGGGDVVRPKLSFLDEVKLGKSNLKKRDNINPQKKSSNKSQAPFGNEMLQKIINRRENIAPESDSDDDNKWEEKDYPTKNNKGGK